MTCPIYIEICVWCRSLFPLRRAPTTILTNVTDPRDRQTGLHASSRPPSALPRENPTTITVASMTATTIVIATTVQSLPSDLPRKHQPKPPPQPLLRQTANKRPVCSPALASRPKKSARRESSLPQPRHHQARLRQMGITTTINRLRQRVLLL